jgi:hypothetical protein
VVQKVFEILKALVIMFLRTLPCLAILESPMPPSHRYRHAIAQ